MVLGGGRPRGASLHMGNEGRSTHEVPLDGADISGPVQIASVN